MSADGAQREMRDRRGDEAATDTRRYLAAVRRSAPLVALLAVVVAAIVVVISLLLPKSYEARATVVVNVQSGVFGLPDAESQKRYVETLDELVESSSVLAEAAREIGGISVDDLRGQVDSKVDPNGNLIDVIASSHSSDEAPRIANAVATSFLDLHRRQQRRDIAAGIARLQATSEELPTEPGAAGDPARILERIGALRVRLAAAGSDLQVADQAEPPDGPASPHPVRNGIIGLFAGLMLGVLLALGRDQLRPTVDSPRDLQRLTGLTVLAGVPYLGRRLRRQRQIASAIEHETYQVLAAELQLALPADRQHVILVTSAQHGEGKTTVTARLGRVLAESGHDTLLISGDLRWPQLHERFSLRLRPGLSDLLAQAARDEAGFDQAALLDVVQEVPMRWGGKNRQEAGVLAVIASGARISDPVRLMSPQVLHQVFSAVRETEYSYVFVDGPPIRGIADVPRLGREADSVLLVSRLDLLTVEAVLDAQERLSRLPMQPLGHVVIGARTEVSPYYLTQRRGFTKEPL